MFVKTPTNTKDNKWLCFIYRTFENITTKGVK